jgi:predicted nucleotidyltransferase
MTTAEKNQVMQKIGRTARSVAPTAKRVLLFGSRARGDEHEDSDWDVLVLLDKDRIRLEDKDILKSHANVLRTNFGISYMRLFGSVAKDEHNDNSDVDLFVVMPPKAYNLCAAADYLESILGTNVDLIRKHDNMRPFFLNK